MNVSESRTLVGTGTSNANVKITSKLRAESILQLSLAGFLRYGKAYDGMYE